MPRVEHSFAHSSIQFSILKFINNAPNIIASKIFTHSYWGFSNYITTYLNENYMSDFASKNCYVCTCLLLLNFLPLHFMVLVVSCIMSLFFSIKLFLLFLFFISFALLLCNCFVIAHYALVYIYSISEMKSLSLLFAMDTK